MNTNFIWHADKSNHVFYVPYDQVKSLGSKNLEKDFVQKVTKDGRTIYLLKDSTLPEHVKPLFETADRSELKSIQQRVAKENEALNEKQPLYRLDQDMLIMISKANKSSSVSLAHASKRLRDMLIYNIDQIKKNRDIIKFAADDNCFEILKWAYDQKAPADLQYVLEKAHENGNIEMSEWVTVEVKKRKEKNLYDDYPIFYHEGPILKGITKSVKEGDTKFIDWVMTRFDIKEYSYHPSIADIAHCIGQSGNLEAFKKFDEKYLITDRVANQILERGGLSDEIKMLLAERAARYRLTSDY